MIALLVLVSMIVGALCWELVKFFARDRGENARDELRWYRRPTPPTLPPTPPKLPQEKNTPAGLWL